MPRIFFTAQVFVVVADCLTLNEGFYAVQLVTTSSSIIFVSGVGIVLIRNSYIRVRQGQYACQLDYFP
jgi:hypothetical protein